MRCDIIEETVAGGYMNRGRVIRRIVPPSGGFHITPVDELVRVGPFDMNPAPGAITGPKKVGEVEVSDDIVVRAQGMFEGQVGLNKHLDTLNALLQTSA